MRAPLVVIKGSSSRGRHQGAVINGREADRPESRYLATRLCRRDGDPPCCCRGIVGGPATLSLESGVWSHYSDAIQAERPRGISPRRSGSRSTQPSTSDSPQQARPKELARLQCRLEQAQQPGASCLGAYAARDSGAPVSKQADLRQPPPPADRARSMALETNLTGARVDHSH